MAASVVLRRDFQIFPAHVTVRILVLDAHIGEVDLVVAVQHVVIVGPFGDLAGGAIRAAVVVLTLAIALMKPSLIVAFQPVIEGHPFDASAARWDLSVVITAASLEAWHAQARLPVMIGVFDELAARAAVVKAWTFQTT